MPFLRCLRYEMTYFVSFSLSRFISRSLDRFAQHSLYFVLLNSNFPFSTPFRYAFHIFNPHCFWSLTRIHALPWFDSYIISTLWFSLSLYLPSYLIISISSHFFITFSTRLEPRLMQAYTANSDIIVSGQKLSRYKM